MRNLSHITFYRISRSITPESHEFNFFARFSMDIECRYGMQQSKYKKTTGGNSHFPTMPTPLTIPSTPKKRRPAHSPPHSKANASFADERSTPLLIRDDNTAQHLIPSRKGAVDNLKKQKKSCQETICKEVPPSQAHGKENEKKKCLERGCGNNARGARGYCAKHDPQSKQCDTVGCNRLANCKGKCSKCDPNRQKCSEPNCTSKVVSGGKCKKHNDKTSKCKEKGCTNQTSKGEWCRKHHPSIGECKAQNCTNQAYSGGLCRKHQPEWKCQERDCNNQATLKGGYCAKHGRKY